jgi:hypothetical protein
MPKGRTEQYQYGVHEVSSKQSIAELAYHLWNARGRPHGSEEEDWLEAERQLATAKEADRDDGGREGAVDASLKETVRSRDAAASHPVDLPPSNAREKKSARDKKSVAGKSSASRKVSNPPVDETDDGPKTAPRDIGEG